jgi:hypothetical protein
MEAIGATEVRERARTEGNRQLPRAAGHCSQMYLSGSFRNKTPARVYPAVRVGPVKS